jgi:hypothetical protein
MVKLAEVTYDRALEIDKFWRRDWSNYSIPDTSHCIIESAVIDSNGKTIAYGQVRHFAELMLFTDMQASLRDRSDSIKLLMSEAFRGMDKAGLPECYCLIKDMRFARLIAKHFDFKINDNPGVLLYKDLRD